MVLPQNLYRVVRVYVSFQILFESGIFMSIVKLRVISQGVLRFELDTGVPLEPQNPYPSLRVILAEKGTHF